MKRTRFVLGTILAVIFALFAGPSTVQLFAQGGTWATKAPMPTPRYGLSTSMVNGIIYAVGGYNSNGYLATVEAYDPATNTWTSKASMPTASYGLSTSVVNGVIYAVGGQNNNADVLGTVQAYDPGTDTWTTKASMPTARYGLSASVVNGIIYAVGGGYDPNNFLATVEAYDPASDTWTTKASMPTARFGPATSVVNGVIYAVGGQNNAGVLGTVEAYDPGTDTWTTKASMPTARYWLSTSVMNNIIFAIGGRDSSISPSGTVEAYDPASDIWAAKTSMLAPRAFVGTSVVNGVIYAVGGLSSNNGYLATNEAFRPTTSDGVPIGAQCVTPPGGMVAWWPGDDNANDIIGGNNGTLQNGATFATGAVAQAFSFDGVNQYLDAGNGPGLEVSAGDFTVDAWVKFDSLATPADMSIVDKMQFAGPVVNGDGWRLIKQADNRFWFCLGGGSFNGCTPGGPLTVQSNTVATTGAWYHVTAVKASGVISLYVNGSLETSRPLGAPFLDTNSTDLLIGSSVLGGGSAYLNGRIDEVELFDRALSPVEIQAIYNAGTAGKCKPTTVGVTSSADPSLLGQSVTFTATLTSGGNPITSASGETVTFSDGTTTLGTGTLNSSGQATFSTSTLAVGVHSIRAAYGGDGSFAGSTSPPLTQDVAYGICALYDQTKAVKSGSVFPIKLDLCDVNGTDVSSSGIVVHATGVTAVSGYSGAPETVGNANPDFDFRFDSTLGTTGGYIFNLGTSGLASGTYSLQFRAGADPASHSVTFGVK
jgi:concanavalin A-like lectin/glucanase superfamily protein/Big-like domain-containing protein/Kelch motif protein